MTEPAAATSEKRRRDLELFCSLALLGPAEILEQVATPADAKQRFGSFDTENARDFFLFRSLLEVQKAGTSMRRCSTFLDTFEALPSDAKKNAYCALDVEAFMAELSVWHRRLVEVLFRLIGFSTTNEVAYFYHHLSVAELEGLLFEQAEQNHFFGSKSDYVRRRSELLVTRIEELASSGAVDVARCWYVRETFASQLKKRRGPFAASVNTLAQFALRHAKLAERRSLGYCYRHAFSVPSATMHFNPVPDDRLLDIANVEVTCFRIAFLAFSVIARVEELWGMSVDGPACKAARAAAARTDIVGAFEARAEVSDFVTVAADRAFIAEVQEVIRSDYGNESYRVRYLSDRPHPDVQEDTVMPDLVHGYVKGREAIAELEENLRTLTKKADGSVDEVALRELLDSSGDAMRRGIATTWTLGMREYVHREMAKGRGEDADGAGDPGSLPSSG